MTPICITAPALEPLSLAEAKDWLKVDSTADDTLILALIMAARIHIEQATRLLLLTQSWKLVVDQWPCQRQWRGRIVDLPLSPVQSLASITLYDDYDVPTIINPATYRLDKSQANPRLIFSSVPPAPQRVAQGIEIVLVNGFGDTAASVPEPLRQAIRLLLAHFYLNRGDVTAPVPVSVQALIAPFRRLKVRA